MYVIKFNNYGISENMFNWVKMYLTNRSQYVLINDNTSGIRL